MDGLPRRMRAPFAVAVLTLAMHLEVAAGQWDLEGAVSGRGFAADGPPPWIDSAIGGKSALLEVRLLF